MHGKRTRSSSGEIEVTENEEPAARFPDPVGDGSVDDGSPDEGEDDWSGGQRGSR